MKSKVFIGIPTYDNKVLAETIPAIMQAKKNPETSLTFRIFSFSALCANFNILFAEALAGAQKLGYTHFVLLHADIFPEAGWLDKMLEIMQRTEAEILSAIIPIKDSRGVTSTARESDNRWRPIRYTLNEVYKMEPTFTDPAILLNSGLMIVDLRGEWTKQIWFRTEDMIVQNAPGEFTQLFISEDWLFSRDARKLGVTKQFATREVRAQHVGTSYYGNDSAWGTAITDVKAEEEAQGVMK